MSSLKSQSGVGLMEVLVSMLVLAIGVFGFIALQARATTATAEALKRSDGQLILQGLAERIRLNAAGDYKAAAVTKDCSTNSCSANDQAVADLKFFSDQAAKKNMTIHVIDCPKTSIEQQRLCLIAAWDKTTTAIAPEPTDGHLSTACLIQDSSQYQDGATCLLMEVY
ncbi:MAG TPA: type IV pilus modification protein PilV [Acinetobacter lwoffii]|uniref:Type IV pilus modification protein PilV n=1 Tax=Acinetobacter lwoffii TaxID=28090 RepID=A0A9D2ZYB4_ACILW|nr:type IV pilus modification protein PilV [Acinetobacter lwoffii]